tara:strand:- start:228 stop:470 length:243 start_codon:yes stop_codon:yes gene_type:complete
MSNSARKIKRKRMHAARKSFMKEFKRTMRKFKKQVVCKFCKREPHHGENIDNWHLNKYSEKIDLMCTECYTERESEVTYD